MKYNSSYTLNPHNPYIHPQLFKKRAQRKGWGIFTRAPIAKGEIIGIEGEGAIWTEQETKQLRALWGDYFHQVAEHFHWGPARKGDYSMLDFINHSCSPNAGLSGDMTFVALHPIQKDEEITWDYATSESDPEYHMLCRCGSAKCRGKISGNDWKNLPIQQRYHGNFSPYLEKKIEQELKKRNLQIIGHRLFFADRTDPHQISLHEINRIIAEKQSPYQYIQILDTKSFGRVLVLDGGAQISEKDGYCYTESLVWPALLSHPHPQRVLVLGGGDGDTIAEVLQDTRVRHVTMVDIDAEVLHLTQRHLPMLWQNAHRDPRLAVITSLRGGMPADALAFLEQNKTRFDIIISDLTDPYESSASSHLTQEYYFQCIRSNLAPGGIFVIQAGELTNLSWKGHYLIRKLMDKIFPQAISYRVFVPWFDSLWSFIIAGGSSKHFANIKKESTIARLLKKHHPRVGGFSYLTPASFMGLFNIEPELEAKISPLKRKQKGERR